MFSLADEQESIDLENHLPYTHLNIWADGALGNMWAEFVFEKIWRIFTGLYGFVTSALIAKKIRCSLKTKLYMI